MAQFSSTKQHKQSPYKVLLLGVIVSVIVFIYSYHHEHVAEEKNFEILALHSHQQLEHRMKQTVGTAKLLNQAAGIFSEIASPQLEGVLRALKDAFPYIGQVSFVGQQEHFPIRLGSSAANAVGKGVQNASKHAPVNDKANAKGFELLLPIDRRNPVDSAAPAGGSGNIGFTSIVISADKLFESVLSGLPFSSQSTVGVRVYAGGAARPANLFFQSGDADDAGPAPSRCLFSCGPASVAKNYNWGGKLWHVVISKQAEPFSEAHAGSLGFLLAGLLASIGATLHIQTKHSHTEQAYQLAAKRSAELRSLNAILVADIEARKKMADDLGRSHQELRQLAEHNARVKEDERKRIAREIHDDLGQSMLALRIDLALMANGALQPLERERINHALLQIDNTVDSMRMIINELRPAVLDLGLDAAVEWEVSKFQRRTGIECHLRIEDDRFVLSDEVATALYRVVQESMTNIMRHARASRVDITLWSDNGWMFLTLTDNGIGMTEQCRRKAKSFGLIGIAERIYALGGAFDTDSETGKGTTLTIAVPFAAQKVLGAA